MYEVLSLVVPLSITSVCDLAHSPITTLSSPLLSSPPLSSTLTPSSTSPSPTHTLLTICHHSPDSPLNPSLLAPPCNQTSLLNRQTVPTDPRFTAHMQS